MYKRILIVSTIIIMILAMIDFGLSDKKEFTPTSNTSPPKEWVKFVPFTGKFTVYLPKTPKYAVDIVNVPNTDIQRWYEMYVSEEINGTVYLLNLISYGPDYPITDAKNILHNVVNEIVARNLSNRLTKLEDGKFQNQPAIFFQIEKEIYFGKVLFQG